MVPAKRRRRVAAKVPAKIPAKNPGEIGEKRTEAGKKLARSRALGATPPRTETTLADEVVRKVLSEEYSRAASLLASPGLAPLTQETAETLQRLLQPKPQAELAPGARPPAPFPKKVSKQALRNSAKGCGAAVGGSRFEHWKVVPPSPLRSPPTTNSY